jgi:hypothetical protein
MQTGHFIGLNGNFDPEINSTLRSSKRSSSAVSAVSAKRAPSLRASSILNIVVKIDQHNAFHVDTVARSKEEIQQGSPLHEVLALKDWRVGDHASTSRSEFMSSVDFQPRVFVRRMRKTLKKSVESGSIRRVGRSLLSDIPKRGVVTAHAVNPRPWIELKQKMALQGEQGVISEANHGDDGRTISNSLQEQKRTGTGSPSLVIITSKSPRYDPMNHIHSPAFPIDMPLLIDQIDVQDLPSQTEVVTFPESALHIKAALASTEWFIPSLERLLLNPAVGKAQNGRSLHFMELAENSAPCLFSQCYLRQ